MYLKRITLQGFKSFARKTVLEFGSGITVIVGPNGAGKSNISDAVKWVLGEQSMKNLRSKKSEDVIFVGSGRKSKAGMAEVSLELDNREKIVPIDYTDLDIKRRVFRSGEGEYFLNSSKVRLLDITEILSKSGFGRSTYTIIGQGMVDQLITQTPEERRELFEDASGVKHYYLKKEQTLKKFEETRENLLRVGDIIREIKPRLGNLEKQRKDAEERRVLSSELRELQRKYFGSELKDLKEKIGEYEKKYQEISSEIVKVENEVSELTKKLEGRNSGADKKKEALKEQEIFDLEQKIQNLQDSLLETIKKDAQILEKQKFYKENFAALENELNAVQKSIKEKEEEIEKIKKERQKLEGEEAKLSSLLKSLDNHKSEPREIILKVKNSLEKILKIIETPTKVGVPTASVGIKNLISFIDEQEKEGFGNSEAKRIEIIRKTEKIKFEISVGTQKTESVLEILKVYKNKEQELIKKLSEARNLEKIIPENSQKQSIEEKIKKLKSEKESKRNIFEEIKSKNRSLEGEFFEVEKSYRVKRDVLSDFKDELTKIEIEMARLKTKREDLEEEIKENLRSEEGLEFISISQEQKEIILGKISELKSKLETLGGVSSVDDDKEYKEVKERFDFLTVQSEDLKKALSSTKKVVLELEKKIHDQFREKLEQISLKFNFYFQKLFGGGTAKLILKESEIEENQDKNEQEFVIDIQAVPPGKRVHTLHTLSGGEKALTSIALLFAIFSVNPTPFCVLDEVDATLDESNSLRFADLLSELVLKTQFIVVTHNRETMKKAKVLYGVTMDESKISKVLSLKLEEAEKYSGSIKRKQLAVNR